MRIGAVDEHAIAARLMLSMATILLVAPARIARSAMYSLYATGGSSRVQAAG